MNGLTCCKCKCSGWRQTGGIPEPAGAGPVPEDAQGCALQETRRTSFQGLLLLSFEAPTRATFEQIKGAVRRGLAEHAQNAQHAGALANGALAPMLQVCLIRSFQGRYQFKGASRDS